MLALVIESSIRQIDAFPDVKSFSELPLFNATLEEHRAKELEALNVTETVNLNEKEKIQSIADKISKSSEEYVVVLNTNVFFELNDNAFVTEELPLLSSYRIADNEGATACFVLKKTVLSDILNVNCKAESLYDLLVKHKFPVISGAGFVAEINSVFDYKKLLQDILSCKTRVRLPMVAEGIYASGNIPKGDFTIIPPVYIGENVQIEAECVIGPGAVIFDNTLISERSCVRNSVVMRECFISSDCFVDNSLCGEGASVRRGVAIFSNCIIGEEAFICENSVIESGSYIRPRTSVTEYKNSSINYKTTESESGFYGYSPEKAALLGGAIGTLYKGVKIGVLSSGEINSGVLKLALVSGLISTGATCYELGNSFSSALTYFINYFDLDFGLFVDGTEDGTFISFVDKCGKNLSKDDFYAIKEIMLKNNVKRCTKTECKWVRQLKNLNYIYIQSLVLNFGKKLELLPVFECENEIAQAVVTESLKRIGFSSSGQKITFRINRRCTHCEACVGGKIFPHKRLCDFVSFYTAEKEPQEWEKWRNDAVLLCFRVLEIISDFEFDFLTEIENIPSFFVAEKVIETDKKLSKIATKLSEEMKLTFNEGELLVDDGDVRIKMFTDNSKNKIRILARSFRAEQAEALACGFEDVLKQFSV